MCRYVSFGFLCLCVCVCSADTWTVNPDGSGDFTDIQSAINATVAGDIVKIADGVYTGEGNRNISFLGKAITVKSINGPDLCIVDGTSAGWDSYRGFIFESNETSDSILDGITIRNFWLLTCCEGGAGICVRNGAPTIRNCKITNCHIQTDSCPCIIYGGGIFVLEGFPLFENCIIKANGSSGYGGGISSNDLGNNVVITLNNCLIADNYASDGGGIYGGYTTPGIILFNCFVVNNYGGGLYFEENCYLSVKQCTFAYNSDYGLRYGIPDAIQATAVYRSILWQNGSYGINFRLHKGAALTNYTSDHDPPYPDPKFVNAVSGDYHLQWDSPCIDFCTDPGNDPNDIDFDGEPRQMGAAVDAGADEVGPKQADFSRNGRIGIEDFSFFSSAWRTTPADPNWYLPCDLVKDNIIDANDLQNLCSDWLWQADWY